MTEALRLVLYSPEGSPSDGGVGSFVYNVAKHLSQEVELTIAAPHSRSPDAYHRIISQDNVRISYLDGGGRSGSLLGDYSFQLALARHVRRIRKRARPDLVLTHSGHLPHLFSQFLGDGPLVTITHATVRGFRAALSSSACLTDRDRQTLRLAPFISKMEEISFRRSAAILGVSEFTVAEIIQCYGQPRNRVSLLRNAVDTDAFNQDGRPDIPDKPKRVLIVSRNSAVKGPQLLLPILKELAAGKHRFVVRIAGDFHGKQSLLHLPGWLMRRLSVELLGVIPYFDMPRLYRNADVVLVTSIYDNCPAAILEAMSSSVPVVAPAIGGIPEIVQDERNGLMFHRGNSREAARKVALVLDESIDLRRLGERARTSVLERFSWKSRAAELRTKLEELSTCG